MQSVLELIIGNTMDSLGDRMKRYEIVPRIFLMRRTPVMIRIDGKAFHTWTRWCEKPFDGVFSMMMAETLEFLIQNIQGAVFGYTQSDEISIFLRDYDTFETDMWFDGNVEKIVSIAASLATAKFNDLRPKDINKLAFFDARVNNYPREEVCNYFIWRQNDTLRNAVQALGQFHIGHKAIQGLNNTEVIRMLEEDKGILMHDIPRHFRYGTVVTKDGLDLNVPSFVTDREYVERHVYLNE